MLFLACTLTFCSVASAQPSVTKIDPPNWWVVAPTPGSSGNVASLTSKLMLLITGSHFDDAQVTTHYPGTRITRVQASADGNYLFVWIDLAGAPLGTVPLRISTADGTTTANLPLLARASATGKFEGIAQDDVIYLIMPDRFADGDPTNDNLADRPGTSDRVEPKAYHGGDLRGIREHLPYLRELGVTAIWLTPVWKNADADYHGYHVVDLYATEPHFGSRKELRELVAEAHRVGMKIVLDYVVNHTGPRHQWASDPPTPTWLHGTPGNHLEPVYRFDGLTDPHASRREYRGTLEGWFAGRLPDLNTDDPLLAQYLLQNAEWWLEQTGADAYRLDTFPYSSRRFWSAWHAGLFRAYPHTNTIGEVWDTDVTVTSFFPGGHAQFDGIDTRLTTVFDFPLEFAIRDVVLGRAPARRIVDVLQRDWLYPHPELLVTFFANHDLKRFMSEPGASIAKLKAAYALLATLRGIPQLYYGDEIGMPGGDDPDNRRDFPGGFPGDQRNAFEAAGRTPAEQEVFAYVRSLLSLRREYPALRCGRQWHIGWDEGYYAYLRDDGTERLLIVANSADSARNLAIPIGDTPMSQATSVSPLLDAPAAEITGGQLQVRLPASTVAVYVVR